MVLIGLRQWGAMNVDVDASTLPQTIDLTPPQHHGSAWEFAIVALMGLWLFTAWQRGDLSLDDPAALALPSLVFASVVAYRLYRLAQSKDAVFSGDGVTVTERRLTGMRRWFAPYNAFEGVLRRPMTVPGRRSEPHRHFQVIELLHEDRRKCVPLLVRETTGSLRDRWEDYADRFRIPALEMEGDRISVRDHRDLDRPLAEQIRKTAEPEAPSEESVAFPPGGLHVERHPSGSTTISITVSRRAQLLPFGLVGAGFVAVPLSWAAGQHSLIAVAIGAVCAAALITGGFWLIRRGGRQDRSIALTDGRLIVDDPPPGADREPISLTYGEIESVSVRPADPQSPAALRIGEAEGEIIVGIGLSEDALQWLRDFLIAAIAAETDAAA